MQFDHSFSCEVDDSSAQVTVDFYRANDGIRPTNISKIANSLKIDQSFWSYDMLYNFNCTARLPDGSESSKSATFSSETFPSELKFTVSPKAGVPLQTQFSLRVEKREKLKCEFGYYNWQGRLVIPTSDTADNLL